MRYFFTMLMLLILPLAAQTSAPSLGNAIEEVEAKDYTQENVLDYETLKGCISTQNSFTEDKANLDAHYKNIKQIEDELTRMREILDHKPEGNDAIMQYNETVQVYNETAVHYSKAYKAYKQQVEAYNATLKSYNAQCVGKSYYQDDYDKAVKTLKKEH